MMEPPRLMTVGFRLINSVVSGRMVLPSLHWAEEPVVQSEPVAAYSVPAPERKAGQEPLLQMLQSCSSLLVQLLPAGLPFQRPVWQVLTAVQTRSRCVPEFPVRLSESSEPEPAKPNQPVVLRLECISSWLCPWTEMCSITLLTWY